MFFITDIKAARCISSWTFLYEYYHEEGRAAWEKSSLNIIFFYIQVQKTSSNDS